MKGSNLSINAGSAQRLSENTYTLKNELATKGIGGLNSNSALYTMNYTYNPQGWLTKINDAIAGPFDDTPCDGGSSSFTNSTELFYLKLDYDQKEASMPHDVQKNGNISSMLYQVNGKQTKGYSFNYDFLDRLTDATYGQFDVLAWTNSDFYTSNYSYDVRGNLLTLRRRQQSLERYGTSECFIPETIDSLTYSYQPNSNKLKQVVEHAPCPRMIILPDTIDRDITYAAELLVADKTYIDGRANVNLYADDELQVLDTLVVSNGTGITTSYSICPDSMGHSDGFVQTSLNGEYAYDNTGNMITDPNKGITIAYNHLNLPYKYTRNSGVPQELKIQYDATGRKLYQAHYKNGQMISRRDYIDGIEYKNDTLDAYYHETGRAKFDSQGNILMEYDLKDHLGNVRVRFADKNGNDEIDLNLTGADDEILSVNHYYPFGLIQQGIWQKTDTGNDNRYAYNNKEYQDEMDIKMYHYGARMMDPALGRWTSTDPLADAYINISPYAYVANTPLNAVDPDGERILFVNGYWNGWIGGLIGSSYPGKKYWGNGFTKAAQLFFSDYSKVGDRNYIDGSSWFGGDDSGGQRKRRGYKYAKKNYASLTEGLADGETFKLVTHSEGGAFGAGIAEYLMEQGHTIESVLHLSTDEGDEFSTPAETTTYQLGYGGDWVTGNKEISGTDVIGVVDKFSSKSGKRKYAHGSTKGASVFKDIKALIKAVADGSTGVNVTESSSGVKFEFIKDNRNGNK